MQDIKEIRYNNFMALARGYRRINEFCAHVQISQSYYSQIKAKLKSIGNDISRRTEDLLGLPHGWMDTPHDSQVAIAAAAESRAAPQAPAVPAVPASDDTSVLGALSVLTPSVRERMKGLIFALAAEAQDARAERAEHARGQHLGEAPSQLHS